MLAFFGGHSLKEVFQTLHDYNLAQGLAIYTCFDDLALISRSHICQNHELQIIFKILFHCSLMVHGCYTQWKVQAQFALCDWCVCKRHNDTIFVILHLDVSRLLFLLLCVCANRTSWYRPVKSWTVGCVCCLCADEASGTRPVKSWTVGCVCCVCGDRASWARPVKSWTVGCVCSLCRQD